MPKVASRNGGVREETLADRLADGPLPLTFALRCATDVAAALRELHEVGRAHGEVSPASVVLRPSGAALRPPNGLLRQVSSRADVLAFGAVLYEMLTSGKPPRGPLAVPEERGPHTGAPGLRAAAMRLAAKCLATPPDQAPTIQMVVTEVRLLNVLARQSGAESSAPLQHAPAPQTRRKADPLAEWTAATRLVEKPEHAAPAESFVDGEPTREFVSAMMSRKHAPSPPPPEPDAELPEEEEDSGPDTEDESDDRAPSPRDKCPKCGSREIHRSHARTKLEFLAANFGIPICRCHRCFHRYAVVFRFAFSRRMPG
jgi:serine/threonine protein kinase